MAAMRERNVQVWLLCVARLVCQATRLSLGGLMPMMAADLGLSTAQQASLLSAFPLGYLLSQVLGGSAADRLGGKPVLGVVLLSTGAATLLLACLSAFAAMLPVVLLFGLLQGPLFPASGVLLTRWIPREERATATAIVDLGNPLGAIAALSGIPVLATHCGWRGALALAGAASLASALAWQLLGASAPSASRRVRRAELDELRVAGLMEFAKTQQAALVEKTSKVGAWRLLTVPAAWGVLLANVAFNFQRYLTYTWITTYYTDALLMPVQKAAVCMLWANVADMALTLAAGRVADKLASCPRVSTVAVRRLFAGLGFLGTGLGLQAAGAFAGSPWVVNCSIIFACSMQACHVAGFKSSYIELSREHAGALAGVGNTMASLSALAVPLVGAAVLEAGGGPGEVAAWHALFATVLAAGVLGTVTYAALVSGENIDERLKECARPSFWKAEAKASVGLGSDEHPVVQTMCRGGSARPQRSPQCSPERRRRRGRSAVMGGTLALLYGLGITSCGGPLHLARPGQQQDPAGGERGAAAAAQPAAFLSALMLS